MTTTEEHQIAGGGDANPRWEVRVGDCIDVLQAMPDNSVDAIVCDPPYG